MRGPLDVHRHLLAADVPHEIVHLGRRIASAHELADALGVAPAACAVAHVVMASGQAQVAVLAAGTTWSPSRLAHALRSPEVRAATAVEASALTDYSSGLVSPLALPAGIRVIVDAEVLRSDVVYAAAGETTTAVKVRSRDLVAAAGAVVDAIAEPTTDPLPGAAFDVGGFAGRFAVSAG